MSRKIIFNCLRIASISLIFTACVPGLVHKSENKKVPANYSNSQDTTNTAKVGWKKYFTDIYLNALIDTALKNRFSCQKRI